MGSSGAAIGTTGLTLAGTVVGSYFGGSVGGAIGGMAGGLIGSAIFNRSQKPLIPDWHLSSSSFGRPIPIIYGQVRLPATVMWQTPIVVKQHGGITGGKGMGGSKAASYYQSAALAFCQGPAKLLKLWTDGTLFFDATGRSPHELSKYRFAIRTYPGDEFQLPDPSIAEWVRNNVIPGDACPAYRGLFYTVFQQVDLAHFGNRWPNVTALVSSDTSETLLLTKLQRWTQDVSADTSIKSVAVDWVRGLVYQLSNDSTIRAYDVQTGLCVAARQWTGTVSTLPVPISAIGCVQGGLLYVVNASVPNGPGWTHQGIWWLNPTTLVPIGSAVLAQSASGYGRVFPTDYYSQIIAVTLVGPGFAPIDVLVGQWLFTNPFIADPMDGHTAEDSLVRVLYHPCFNLDAVTQIVIGRQDPLAGTVDVWWVFSNLLLFPHALVFTTTIRKQSFNFFDNSRISFDFKQILDIQPSTFGEPPDSFWTPSLALLYDPADNTLIITETSYNKSLKINRDGSGVWLVAPGFPMSGDGVYYNTDSGNAGGAFWNADMTTGTVQRQSSFQTYQGTTFLAGTTFAYDSHLNAAVFQSISGLGGLFITYLQRATGNEYPVADILTDLCRRAGLTAIDVSAVTQTTIGYAITEAKSAGACIADLCHTYQIDMVESDYTLKFIPKGSASVVTIPQDDLGSVDQSDPSRFWPEKDSQEQELPLQINVRHVDPDLDFQPGAAYGKRTALPVPTQLSRRVRTIDLPVVATNLEARRIAESWLFTLWAERKTYETQLSAKYLWLDPTDTVTVAMDAGDRYTVRIESTDIGADFSLRLALASENSTVYAPSALPAAAVGFAPQLLIPGAFAELFLLDVPLLQDADDLGGVSSRIYYATGPNGPIDTSSIGFLYKSPDANTFDQIDTIANYVTWAHATQPLGNTVAPFSLDLVNTLTVHFPPGSDLPVGCSYDDLMNGTNPAIVGQEIIQYQNVAENADGSVTLSTLLRGRRGTEWATGNHASGETVILLAAGRVEANRITISEIGQTEYWKFVPSGRTPDQVPVTGFAYTGKDLKPYAPVNFSRSASGADLLMTWIRRSRIGGWQLDGSDTTPLAEATEAYEVYLLANAAALATFDPTVPASYVRAFTGLSAPTLTYTAAQMATDGFTPGTGTLYVCAYQISAVIGRGFRAYAALPAL